METGRPQSREQILPIDRGWAWVVVIASSLIFALVAGEFKSQGILLVELMERHPEIPKSDLLWVFNISNIMCVLGPLVSYLVTKFTNRTVLIGGILLYSSGFVGLAFTKSLPGMILSFGVLTGIATPVAYITTALTAAQYFNKRKALAFGIVASGSGLGSLILPYIFRVLFDSFCFPEAMIYYAGFVLNFVCVACLLRPISFYESLYAEDLRLLKATNDERNVHTQTDNSDTDTEYVYQEIHERPVSESNFEEEMKPLLSYDLATSPSKISIKFTEITQHNRGRRESYETTEAREDGYSSAKQRFNIKVFYDPKLIMLTASFLVYCLGFMVGFQCLPPLAKDSGVPKSTVALVFTLVGSLEIFSRVANGYLADKHIITGYTLFTMNLLLSGCLVLAGVLLSSLSGLAGFIAALFGLAVFGTSIFSLIPVVLTELLGPENLTTSVGIQLATEGAAVLLSTFITGWIYDATGSWRVVFMYITGCMITGALMLLPYCFPSKSTCQHPTTNN